MVKSGLRRFKLGGAVNRSHNEPEWHSHSLKFCFQPLTCFGNGGGRNPKQDGLLRHGELEVREDVDADVALGESWVGFPEGIRGMVEGIPEHPFQFRPFFVLDISGDSMELLEEMVLTGQGVQYGIGVHVAAGTGSRSGNVFFSVIGSGADDHQECAGVLSQDF